MFAMQLTFLSKTNCKRQHCAIPYDNNYAKMVSFTGLTFGLRSRQSWDLLWL